MYINQFNGKCQNPLGQSLSTCWFGELESPAGPELVSGNPETQQNCKQTDFVRFCSIYKSAWNPPFWSGAICLPVSKIIQFGNWEYRFVMVCLVFVFWKTCFVIKFSEALPYYRECILSRLQETIPRYRTLKPETTSFPKFTVTKPVWPFIPFWDRWGSKSITVWEWRDFFHIVRTRKTGPRKTKNIDENILSSAFLSRPYLWFGPTNANSRLYRRVGKDSLKRPQQESGEGQHDVPWSELACGCLFPLQNGLDIEDIEGMLDS